MPSSLQSPLLDEAHSAHTSIQQKDLIIDTQSTADGAVALSTILPSHPAPSSPGAFVSAQRAREDSDLRVLGCVRVKAVLLVFVCLLTFGSYWVYDIPGALSQQLQAWFGPSYSPAMNASLYSVYSYPNVVLPFFSGLIVDNYTGVRGGAFLFASLITVGHALFCVGVQWRSFPLALVGRFIFGLGGESLTVVQNTFVVRWFDGRWLALAFSLVLAFARVGTSVNFIVSPKLATDGVPASIWLGAGMTVVSFGACCLAAWTDWYADSRIRRERRQMIRALPAAQRRYIREQDRLHEPKPDKTSLSDVRQLPLEAWLLYLICVLFYVSVLTFYSVAQDILVNTGRQYSADTADLLISIPSFVSIIATPLFGIAIDRRGRALYWIVLASALLCIGHVFFLLMSYDVGFALALTPVPVMLLIGVAYSMGGAAVWPILAYVVDTKMAGTAYGAMTAIQNAGLAAFPQIIGGLRGIPALAAGRGQYVAATAVFVCCGGLSAAVTVFLIGKDAASGRRLNASPEERERALKQKEAAAAPVDGAVHEEEQDAGKETPLLADARDADGEDEETQADEEEDEEQKEQDPGLQHLVADDSR